MFRDNSRIAQDRTGAAQGCFLTAQVEVASDAPHGDFEQGVAGASVQVAGLASNVFECKSGPIQLFADVRRDFQFPDIERG